MRLKKVKFPFISQDVHVPVDAWHAFNTCVIIWGGNEKRLGRKAQKHSTGEQFNTKILKVSGGERLKPDYLLLQFGRVVRKRSTSSRERSTWVCGFELCGSKSGRWPISTAGTSDPNHIQADRRHTQRDPCLITMCLAVICSALKDSFQLFGCRFCRITVTIVERSKISSLIGPENFLTSVALERQRDLDLFPSIFVAPQPSVCGTNNFLYT